MKYKVGDKVRIKSIDWYNENKNKFGNIWGHYPFDKDMSKYCGKVMTISHTRGDHYTMVETLAYYWTDNMIEGLVEEETKLLTYEETVEIIETMQGIGDSWECPQGYQFVDENGNVINAQKIELEKVNTLKTQSDNMETETHRGYYTTEPETTCEGKKRCVVYFWDNDFADKVELDLTNRELIQEDGKWFVVKKKKEYPKTYEECAEIIAEFTGSDCNPKGCMGYMSVQLTALQKLLICRNAYWKLYGEEMGLNRPWEPDYDSGVNKFGIIYMNGVVQESNPTTNWERHLNKVLDFPTAEMRDTFKKNFDPDIEICKELL